MKKLLSLLVTLSLFSPVFALAQEAVPVSEAAQAPVVEESSSVEISPDEQITPLVQESDTTQETISSEALESTENPQEQQALEEAIEVIDQATAEEEATSITTEVVDIIEQATTTPVAELPIEILEPQKEYTFEINGSAIATSETPEWLGSANDEAIVEEAPVIRIEDASHELNVSGECSDPYYVILIYNDSEGYNTNPSSYIYNRAYPCENGHYSYSLSSLPFSLESGTFYLLVAGQGNKGPWKPISAMIPIGIIVKTILPPASTTPHESE